MNALIAGMLMLALQSPGVRHHGALAMGFDQDKTSHEFVSTPSGGSIAVNVKEPGDETSRRQIRSHLAEIAKAFAAGDFRKPFQTHGEVPPGVPEMQRLKGVIRYEYADTPDGGIVRIKTTDPNALAAVHAFLAYQRLEHRHTAKEPNPDQTRVWLRTRPGSGPGLTPL